MTRASLTVVAFAVVAATNHASRKKAERQIILEDGRDYAAKLGMCGSQKCGAYADADLCKGSCDMSDKMKLSRFLDRMAEEDRNQFKAYLANIQIPAVDQRSAVDQLCIEMYHKRMPKPAPEDRFAGVVYVRQRKTDKCFKVPASAMGSLGSHTRQCPSLSSAFGCFSDPEDLPGYFWDVSLDAFRQLCQRSKCNKDQFVVDMCGEEGCEKHESALASKFIERDRQAASGIQEFLSKDYAKLYEEYAAALTDDKLCVESYSTKLSPPAEEGRWAGAVFLRVSGRDTCFRLPYRALGVTGNPSRPCPTWSGVDSVPCVGFYSDPDVRPGYIWKSNQWVLDIPKKPNWCQPQRLVDREACQQMDFGACLSDANSCCVWIDKRDVCAAYPEGVKCRARFIPTEYQFQCRVRESKTCSIIPPWRTGHKTNDPLGARYAGDDFLDNPSGTHSSYFASVQTLTKLPAQHSWPAPVTVIQDVIEDDYF